MDIYIYCPLAIVVATINSFSLFKLIYIYTRIVALIELVTTIYQNYLSCLNGLHGVRSHEILMVFILTIEWRVYVAENMCTLDDHTRP